MIRTAVQGGTGMRHGRAASAFEPGAVGNAPDRGAMDGGRVPPLSCPTVGAGMGTSPPAGALSPGDMWNLFRAGFLAVAGLVMLASCAYMPVAVDGIRSQPEAGAQASENPWVFVPVGAWITRDTVTPVSVGMCEGEACPTRIAVAVVEARGAEAASLARTLRQPPALASRLEESNRRRIALVAEANRRVPAAVAARRMPHRIAASARSLRHRNFSGFSMVMRRASDGGRVAHAAVLGRQRGRALRLVIVIGPSAQQVENAAKSAAAANL